MEQKVNEQTKAAFEEYFPEYSSQPDPHKRI
jgi:hypothetical protein